MSPSRPDLDPYVNDPTRWATSMRNHAELMLACLDAVAPRSVVEVGAFAGDLTALLADWAQRSGARVAAVDPSPRGQLVQLDRDRAELELIRETSLEALARIAVPDVVIIDGDHNYYTVSQELALLEARAQGADLPLMLFHDVCWPHARRDDYFDATLIPAEYRQPLAGEGAGIVPDEPRARPGGLPYPRSAALEGGPRNGVLTAVEDHVGARDDLRLVVVPAFFGFGAVWHRGAPWADGVGAILDPWDRNPLMQRLEENRVHHLTQAHLRQGETWRLQERQARQETVLNRLLESSAFALAERLSRLRERVGIATGQSVVSKDEIRRALDG